MRRALVCLLVAGCGGPAARAPAPAVANRPASAPAAPPLIAGTLRLEGQVLDAGERPLAGVALATVTDPPAQATSEADGFFAFDDLAAGTYVISARAADGRAGTATAELTVTSDPVLVRVR